MRVALAYKKFESWRWKIELNTKWTSNRGCQIQNPTPHTSRSELNKIYTVVRWDRSWALELEKSWHAERDIFLICFLPTIIEWWVIHTEVYTPSTELFDMPFIWQSEIDFTLELLWADSFAHVVFYPNGNGNNSVATMLTIWIDLISVHFFHTLGVPLFDLLLYLLRIGSHFL